ncbi:MAG TPA: tetratricopeptide repeat protein [Solirubrobacterales bacterium]|nr:tetratricopeptide repeat protein [Solirubrobacterales bacterium]
MAATLVAAAGTKVKSFWLKDQEGARLIKATAARVKADADVDYAVREELARKLPAALRAQPETRGALVHLLEGKQVPTARNSLAVLVARLMQDEVRWPEGFSASEFGTIVARHAAEAVNEVKASDRSAAHTDATKNHEAIEALPKKVVEATAGAKKLPLRRPFAEGAGPQAAADSASLLEMLRASQRRFPLVGRDEILERAGRWLAEPAPGGGDDHRVMVIHGPAGAGKTRLAAEILSLLDETWRAGFLVTPEPGSEVWEELSFPSRPLALAIDYSEARRVDLQHLFAEPLLGARGEAPLRVILLVREGKLQTETWAMRLGGLADLEARGTRLLANDRVEEISLVDSLPEARDRQKLWDAASEILGSSVRAPGYLANPPFERPLYVLFDAHRHSTGGVADDAEPGVAPGAEQLIRGVLVHEGKYWVQSREALDAEIDLPEERMNQVAVVATLIGGASRQDFETALTALPWLADEEQRRRVAGWWGSVYATSSDTVRGVEPDIVGEYLVVRALGERSDAVDKQGGIVKVAQLTELVASMPLPASQRLLRVLTRIANNSDLEGAGLARTALGEILSRHLAALLPGALGTTEAGLESGADVGESFATTIAAAAVAANALALLEPASERSDRLGDGSGVEAADPTRDAALQLIRRHVERIADQELEARRWDLARYLEIVRWAVSLDLKSGQRDRAEHRIAEISTLQPPPHRDLASFLLDLGRSYAGDGDHRIADDVYQKALGQLTAVGEEDSELAFVVMHDRGLAAEAMGSLEDAVDFLRAAEAGKIRLRSASHADTVTTSLALVQAIALLDIDEAEQVLEATAARLEDGPEEELDRVRRFRPVLPFVVARAAEREENWDRAERFYKRAQEELAELGGETQRYPEFVIEHDLGDVAAGREEHDRALGHYEAALEGKAEIRGYADPGVIYTLKALVTEIAKENVDKALQRLKAAREKLEAGEVRYSLVIGELEVALLSNAGRFDDAVAVVRRVQTAHIDELVLRAILEASVEPSADATNLTPVAVQAATLAAKVFGGGDLRLAALASRLVDAVGETVGSLIVAQVSDPAVEGFLPPEVQNGAGGGGISVEAASHDGFEWSGRRIAEAIPNYLDFVIEGIVIIDASIERALANPIVAALSSSSPSDPGTLVDDRAMRGWLARTALFNPEDAELCIGGLLTMLIFCMHLRLGFAADVPLRPEISEIRSAPRNEEVRRSEMALIAEDLRRVSGLSDEEVEHMVAATQSRFFTALARVRKTEAEWGEAESLFRRALAENEALGEAEIPITYAMLHELGEIASTRGNQRLALDRYQDALAGKIEHTGLESLGSDWVLNTIHAIVSELSLRDVERGLEWLRGAHAELEANGLGPRALEGLFRHEILLLTGAGRSEEAGAAARRAARLRVEEDLRAVVAKNGSGGGVVEDTPTELALSLCIVAAGLVPADDPRLAALASRLADVIMTSVGFLFLPALSGASMAGIPSIGLGRRPGAEAGQVTRYFGSLPSDTRKAMEEVSDEARQAFVDSCEIVKAAAAELDGELLGPVAPEAAEVSEPPARPGLIALNENRAVRRWLARTVFAGASDEQGREGAAGALLAFRMGLRLGLVEQVGLFEFLPRVWASAGSDAAAEAEAKALAADLLEAGGEDAQAVELLLGAGKASSIFVAGVLAEEEGDIEQAGRLFARCLDELAKISRLGSESAYVVLHELGDVHMAAGEGDRAEDLFRFALEGKIASSSERWDPSALVTRLRLADAIRLRNADRARAEVEEALAEAELDGAAEAAEGLRRWLGAEPA